MKKPKAKIIRKCKKKGSRPSCRIKCRLKVSYKDIVHGTIFKLGKWRAVILRKRSPGECLMEQRSENPRCPILFFPKSRGLLRTGGQVGECPV